MNIVTGLFDNIVMQRNSDNVCEQLISGITKPSGTVVISCGDITSSVKADAKGAFEIVFKGLPSGGPYTFKIIDPSGESTVRNVLVGDVWILAGQSNMEGIGNLDKADTPDENVHAFYMDNTWGVAADPINNLDKAKAEIHWILRGGRDCVKRSPYKGTSSGVTFGKKMYRASGIPQGLLPCAHGGTRMTQWAPALADKGDESLYGAMMNRIARNGGTVAGMLWYQGCSDANIEESKAYFDRTKSFFEAVRNDLGMPRMPIVMAQIGRVISPTDSDECWTAVRDDQLRMQSEIPYLAVVPTIDLDLDDCIHISGTAQKTLGSRMAEAMRTILKQPHAQKMPIELDSIVNSIEPRLKYPIIKIKFKNVKGSLSSTGRPSGFTILAGKPTPEIFRIDLEKDMVILHLTGRLPCHMLEVAYGYGLDSFCNISDDDARPLPAFGPKRVASGHLCTPFPKMIQVSKGIFDMSYADAEFLPDTFPFFEYAPAECISFYCYPRDMAVYSNKEHIRIFRCAYDFPKDMRIEAGFGYDGPIHLFMDGKKIFSDPAGTNPIVCDTVKIPLSVEAGRHEFYAVLDARRGFSWGISFIIYNTEIEYTTALKQSDLEHLLPQETGFTNDSE